MTLATKKIELAAHANIVPNALALTLAAQHRLSIIFLPYQVRVRSDWADTYVKFVDHPDIESAMRHAIHLATAVKLKKDQPWPPHTVIS